MTISGTALNTARRIELINSDGSSLDPATYLDLPYPGVSVDDNGSRIQISSNTFLTSTADGNGSADLRKFKIFNAVGVSDSNTTFNVNAQPSVLFLAGFTAPFTFNRDATTGDNVTLTGSNLKNVTEIQLVDENGSDLSGTPASRFQSQASRCPTLPSSSTPRRSNLATAPMLTQIPHQNGGGSSS